MDTDYNVIDAFHGCKYAYFDDESYLWYIWHGGSIVNIYTENLVECDVFTNYSIEDSNIEDVIIYYIATVKREREEYV